MTLHEAEKRVVMMPKSKICIPGISDTTLKSSKAIEALCLREIFIIYFKLRPNTKHIAQRTLYFKIEGVRYGIVPYHTSIYTAPPI
jgi:hypothetical protein